MSKIKRFVTFGIVCLPILFAMSCSASMKPQTFTERARESLDKCVDLIESGKISRGMSMESVAAAIGRGPDSRNTEKMEVTFILMPHLNKEEEDQSLSGLWKMCLKVDSHNRVTDFWLSKMNEK